jgi:glycosyltransferase involved in cell wall biosynthesis
MGALQLTGNDEGGILPLKKPRIVHVIDSLARGGAETLLVNLLPDLSRHFDVVLVTLNQVCDFDPEEVICSAFHCLDVRRSADLAPAALRLRRLIRQYRPDLVRAQLYTSSLIARVATPKEVPLIFSIHSRMSSDAYTRNRLALPLEKLTYAKRHGLVAVSNDALTDFDGWVGIKGRSWLLHNYVSPLYFERSRVRTGFGSEVRMVSVGMLKEAKNYFFLLEAMKQLRDVNISLHIYGEGALRAALQHEIDAHRLPVVLKGKRSDIFDVLPNYDLFAMSSTYEGFGIAPAEAMAAGLPLLLSDLTVLREVTHGNALFFDPADPASFASAARNAIDGRADVESLSRRGIQIAREHYQKEGYLRRLLTIYEDVAGAAAPTPADPPT